MLGTTTGQRLGRGDGLCGVKGKMLPCMLINVAALLLLLVLNVLLLLRLVMVVAAVLKGSSCLGPPASS